MSPTHGSWPRCTSSAPPPSPRAGGGHLGPRQCGKSTLARHILESLPGAVYLDLERPAHASRLRDPEGYFAQTDGKLVCLDEVQRVPDLFPVIKSVVDERGGNGHFLVLGSAAPGLLRQSSESLAGRIRFEGLTPFLHAEIKGASKGRSHGVVAPRRVSAQLSGHRLRFSALIERLRKPA